MASTCGHEEVAAFCGGSGLPHLTNELAVCAGQLRSWETSTSLMAFLIAIVNRVPVVAIAAQIPKPRKSAVATFKRTHPEHLFKDCSHLLAS